MEDNLRQPAPDPIKVMADIRNAAASRQESNRADSLVDIARPAEARRETGRNIEQIPAQLGRPPAAPPTLRGRLGGLLIRWLDRLFWWHSASLRELGEALAERQKKETALWNALARAVETLGHPERRRRSTSSE